MQTAEIEPRTIIVEDNEKIQSFLKKRLDVVKKANGHCFIPDITAVRTLAGFEQVMGEISDSSAPFNSMIVDINLGEDHEDDGMKVLELIQERFKGMLRPLVYSAYPNRRNRCIELGVDETGFFVKNDGRLLDDIKKLKKKIEDSFIEAYQEKTLPGDIPLFVANNRAKRAYRYVKSFIEPSDFSGKNHDEKDGVIYSFLGAPIKSGLNVFMLHERLWKFHFKDFDETSVEKKSCFIQEINEHNGNVEGYRLYLNEEIHYINLPDFTIVEEAFDTIVNFVKNEDTLANRFAEFFLATRMVNLYLEGSEAEKQTLVNLSRKFYYPSHEEVFVYGVWEGIAHKEEKDEELHQYFYQQYSKYQHPEIFYGEIIELGETMASVKLNNPTATGEVPVVFYRDISLETLKRFGIKQIDQQFKIITYKESSPQRNVWLILPIPPNMRF